jgi:outer membrane lipoprotein
MRTKQIGLLFVFLGSAALLSCAPAVLSKNYLFEGTREMSFEQLREQPDQFKGRLFILGGVIVRTKLTNNGAVIEAIHVPVDGSGSFKDSGKSEGRYRAVVPSGMPQPDPIIYHKGRRVTIAAEFIGILRGKIDEMDYGYPVFDIKQMHLWPRERLQYYPPSYVYDPWFYPYPYYYRYPWWTHPRRNEPAPVRLRNPPPPRRTPQPDRRRER